LMQDYPKLLPQKTAVGFTQFQRLHAFSAVKNAIADGVSKQQSGNAAEVAATGEQDMYAWSVSMLASVGAKVDTAPATSYRGVSVAFPPHVVFAPSFGVTQQEVTSKLTGGAAIDISAKSSLLVDGENITLQALSLDGALVIHAVPGAHVKVDGLRVQNAGWRFKELTPEEEKSVEQKYAIRGYTLQRHEQAYFKFDQPGEFVLNDETRSQYENKDYKHPARRTQ
jgi:UDP-sugar pyrophosphorylase